MMKHIFRKTIVFIVLIFFLVPSFTPIMSSTIFTSSQYHPQSFDDLDKSQHSPDGLAPKIPTLQKTSSYQSIPLYRGYFYAYNAYDPGGTQMGPITFDTPDAITLLAPGIFPNFCGGADIESDVGTGNWFGCDYAGGLYLIDRDTGTQTYIGPTIGVNGMTYDGTTDTWYVSSSNSLYIMDITTGATTLVGSHGITNTMIGIACNLDGDMFGYDVLFTGQSTLYSIDKSTGAATVVGSMGYGMVYAQDMGFDRDNDILYIAAYFNDGSPSALMTCDYSNGVCTPVGNFQGGMEVDGFAVPWMGIQYDHDIAVSSIIAPASGNAGPITPVVRVKNAGNNTETNVSVQLLIGKEQITGTVEDFEATNGSYTHAPKAPQPDVWAWGVPTSGPNAAHSGVNVWATNLAGSYPASMWCYLVTAPFVVPGGALFNFWHWYYFEANYDGGNVKISTDGGTTWTLITPVGGYPGSMPYNPFMTGQAAYNGQSNGWKQANFDLSAYEGETAQIMFETASDSSVQYAGWYIDDVGFTITSWVNEYTQTATISSIAPDEVVDLSFPTWTPADLGMVEMVNINYNAEATNMLAYDENPYNDYKAKPFTLHYGYFDDVAVTDIISPVSGLAETQTPEVALENHGQNSEVVDVHMTIGKALYTTLLEEDFAGGVPPAGWGTNYPGNWYSSSTNYAGGTAPEAEFSWTPSSVDEHLLYTGVIDTTGFTALALKFKEYVNDYNGDYTLKIVTSTDGGATWNEAWSRAGGAYGPATTDVTLTAANGVGSATLQIAWDMSGDSFNINYWYVDDVWMGIIDMVDEYNETVTGIEIVPGETVNVSLPDWTPSDIPFATTIDYLITANVSMNISDGDPTDNEVGKLITLSYEHDVGVIAITEPSSLLNQRDDVIWDNYADDGTGVGLSSQLDTSYPFNSQCADDFQFTETMDVTGVHWWGAFWNGGTYPNPTEFNIIFYADDDGTPTGSGMDDPTPTALAVYNFPAVTGVSYGADKYEYDVEIDQRFVADAGVKYWITVQEVASFAVSGQWGWSTNGANPDQLSTPLQGFPLLGTPYWTPTIYGDHAFQLSGHGHWQPQWPPGTYPVAGIIKNFGITYSESDIPVNARIINDTGVIVYNETVIFPGPLQPGHTAVVNFPDITIPDIPAAEGDYKLTMSTKLIDDDHPNNDKKTLNFYINVYIPYPPCTYATLSGTMGMNDWYISCVTVTLYTCYANWPPGVNYTMFKVDDGEWLEYTTPIIICKDGYHTVYFYSVGNNGAVEEEKSVEFKIDITPPSIQMSVEKIGFRQWKFIAEATDGTSGIGNVRCLLDDMLLGDISAPGPYEWNWTGKGKHTVIGTVFDLAGNSAESAVTFSLSLTQPIPPYLPLFIQLFIKFLQRFPSAFPLLHSLLTLS
jgi:hypothetical protein